jgi:hypothetical protein
MRSGWWILAAVVFIGTAALRAQTTQPATLPATTAPTTLPPAAVAATQPVVQYFGDADLLLKQLASADWHTRRLAVEQLVRGGVDAKPFIHTLIDRSTDEEARKNAQAAIAQIDETRLIGPSYITLHLHDARASVVMAEISRQCFAPLISEPTNLLEEETIPKITFDCEHELFWKVMPQICQKLGVDLRQWQGGTRLMRGAGMQMDGISKIQGPFLIVANQITYTRTRSFGARRDQTQCGMNFSVYAEPKLTVVHGGGSITVDTALDDHGNSLVATRNRFGGFWGGFGGSGGWNLYAPLDFPRQNPGTKLTRFKANTGFVIQLESQKIEIPDLSNLKQTTKQILGMQVVFEEMKKNADAWQLHVRVAQPNFADPQWQQLMDGIQNRMQVVDAEGIALDHRGMSSNASNTTIELSLEFGRSTRPDGKPSGDPTRLVWEVPTRTRNLTVPVEFDDLPLFDDK